MSKLGLITVRKTKRRLCFLNRISVKDVEAVPPYMVAEIEITEKKLGRISPKKRRKLLNRAEVRLRRIGADRILIDSKYKNLLLAEPHRPGNFLPPRFCFDAFELAAEKVGNRRIKKLAIYDSALRAVCMSRLESVVMAVNSLILYTDKTDEAERLADRLLDKYGILLDVMPVSMRKSEARPEYLIDVDNGRVCAGDFVVNGIELDADLGECCLDNADLADNMELFGDLHIKKLVSGKNTVEISEKRV